MACLCYLRVKYAEKQHQFQDFDFCKAFFYCIRNGVHFRKDMLKRGLQRTIKCPLLQKRLAMSWGCTLTSRKMEERQ